MRVLLTVLALGLATASLAADPAPPAAPTDSPPLSMVIITECGHADVVITTKDGMVHGFRDVSHDDLEAAGKQLPDSSVAVVVVPCPDDGPPKTSI